jgi:signal transduction histidine kinase
MTNNYRWLVGVLLSGLLTTSLSAQSIRVTRLVVVPKPTMTPKRWVSYQATPPASLSLSYKQNDFYIYFDAQGIPPPYQYRLRDTYVDYRSQTANPYVFFTNIPSGKYTFTVWAVGRPAVPPGVLTLRVESPVWLRWWFWSMVFVYVLLLLGATFYLLYRYRLHQFIRLQAVRENIARDLHDDMGSHLSSISILSTAARLSLTTAPDKAQASLENIGRIARQTLDTMSDLVWSVNPANDSMQHVLNRMADVGNTLMTNDTLRFSFQADEAAVQFKLTAEGRRDLFLIYKEAFTNAVRYAHATHIRATVRCDAAGLTLTVQDNGCGFDLAQPTSRPGGGNGLQNLHGGQLRIRSAPGAGTEISITVPS